MCLLLLAISPVAAASSQQATATPTFIPLFPTSTQVDSLNLNCPTALPVGWGTVTPGLLWNSSCGHCQQTLMAPSSTPMASVTPGGPTLTPTATPTLTPTPQGLGIYVDEDFNPSNQGLNLRAYNDGGNWSWVRVDGEITIPTNQEGFYFAYEYQVDILEGVGLDNMHGRDANYLPNDAWWQTAGAEMSVDNLDSPTYWIAVAPYSDPVSYGDGGTTREAVWGNEANYNAWLAYYYSGVNVGIVNVNVLDSPANIGFPYMAEVNRGYQGPAKVLDILMTPVRVWYYGNPPVEPTPTPSPLVADYCGEVNGVTGGSSELGLSLPEFGIGASSCYGITEIILPTSIINFFPGIDIDDVTIPGIQLCFTEISFGNLDLFGVEVNLDSIANLLAAALIIRWLLRS